MPRNYYGSPLTNWKQKAITTLLLIAFLPVLLLAVVKVITDVLWPLAMYALVIFILLVLYRVVFGVRR